MEDQSRARSIRTPLILGALALALLLALLGGLVPREERLDVVAPQVVEKAEEAASSIEVVDERAPERAPIEEAAEVIEGPAEGVVPERGEYPVSGQFILTDCFRQEHAQLDGEFELVYKREGERLERSIPVEGGAFSFTVPDPSDFFVHDMKLADREITLQLEHELTGSHDDQRLLLIAREQCEVRVEVLDAATRGHLSGVEVWSVGRLDSSAETVPKSSGLELVLRDASSPVSLPEVDLSWGTKRTYWVRSEGYAWAKVSVDHTRYSDQVVLLERGGALSVRVEGLESVTVGGSQTYLQLERTADEQQSFERLDSSFHHKWESVPPGAYRVSVVLGDRWVPPLSLGSAEVTVRASEDAQLVLPVDAPEVPAGPVAVNGVVRAHEYWRNKRIALVFYGTGETRGWEGIPQSLSLKEMKADLTDPDLLRWSTEVPCEGTWEVAVKGLSIHTNFSASLAHTPMVELTIPEPALISMQIRDAETEEALPGAQLFWKAAGSTSREEHVWASLEFRPESGTHHITIPAGHVTFDIFCDGYVGQIKGVEFAPGPQELSFDLVPVGRVDVQFMEGGAAIPVSLLDLEFEVRPVSGSGDIYSIWGGSLIFDEPGVYEVKIIGVTGYLDVVTTITAPARGVAKHTIHIVRE
jgi:hypothetical protein